MIPELWIPLKVAPRRKVKHCVFNDFKISHVFFVIFQQNLAENNYLNCVSYSDTSGDDDNDEDDTDESAESNTESDHVDASRESSSSDEDEIYRSSRQKEKMRRRRRKRDLVSKQTQRDISRQKRDKIQVCS